jgi:hypothetical protein
MGGYPRELSGQRFGRLVAVERTSTSGQAMWRFRCDCGESKVISASQVIHMGTRSCGCLRLTRTRNLSGQRFGMLVALSWVPAAGPARWNVQCDCGALKTVLGTCLSVGATQSCGCRRSVPPSSRRHGDATREGDSAEYVAWSGMRNRCLSRTSKAFANYGGRGITVCERWSLFENFLEDMGRRPTPMHSVERLDVNKGYSPQNCVWATRLQQNRNKRETQRLTIDGVSKPIAEWCEIYGQPYARVRLRILKMGWPAKEALTLPRQVKGSEACRRLAKRPSPP